MRHQISRDSLLAFNKHDCSEVEEGSGSDGGGDVKKKKKKFCRASWKIFFKAFEFISRIHLEEKKRGLGRGGKKGEWANRLDVD